MFISTSRNFKKMTVGSKSHRFLFLKDHNPSSLVAGCKKLAIMVKFDSRDYIS